MRRILKDVGVTSIYVTHDRDEAFTMADRLIFMNHGRIIQTGTPEEAVASPADGFVARTLGFKNVLRGIVSEDGEFVKIKSPVGIVTAIKPEDKAITAGSESTFLVHEDGISVSNSNSSGEGTEDSLSGLITERVFRGNRYELRVRIGDGELYCHTIPGAASDLDDVGRYVNLTIDPNSIRFLSGED